MPPDTQSSMPVSAPPAPALPKSGRRPRFVDPAAVLVLVRRGFNEILRVPGASIPGAIAPIIFLVGLTMVFGQATDIPGYGTDSFLAFVLPVALLQSAGFTGGATGVNLGRDIEQGWLDRLLLSPTSRSTILAGLVLSAAARVLIPVPPLLVMAIVLGAPMPSLVGVLIILAVVPIFSAIAATWASVLALKFRSQQASPLIQASILSSILFSTSYAPLELLEPWMRTIAELNPVTYVIEGLRQCFVGEISWTVTWQAFAALGGLGAVFVTLALLGLRRFER
ncbi:MAG: ABC transporter permease [Solirubrobacteraceae bacterium]|nr:ABC transporter permease [Solirubrobacteraceae bacterium]